ncbi:hypothetical protein DSL72_007760 [Monilinia vaccinii-corymbosi]|uniref:2EXR domain-containing protein n=1 Tax=Monilinia vaccinii-corymbosi TaxID=61207 RepID=A0A8A3PIN5_9HELO|nr:hypothetical protein DSL72_007760 [Monilinia vaccinii-corymbosi]
MEHLVPTPPLSPLELDLSTKNFRRRRAEHQFLLVANGKPHPFISDIFEDETATPPPPSVFTQFRKFPASVQEQIWMEGGLPSKPCRPSQNPKEPKKCVCRESSAIALKHYKLSFGLETPEPACHYRVYPIYLNPNHDIVFPVGFPKSRQTKILCRECGAIQGSREDSMDEYRDRCWWELLGSGNEFLKKVAVESVLFMPRKGEKCSRERREKERRARVDLNGVVEEDEEEHGSMAVRTMGKGFQGKIAWGTTSAE